MIDQKFQDYLTSLGPQVSSRIRKALVTYFKNPKLTRGQVYSAYLQRSDIPKSKFDIIVRPVLRDYPVNRAASECWALATSEEGISKLQIKEIADSVRKRTKDYSVTSGSVLARLRHLAKIADKQVYVNDLGVPPPLAKGYKEEFLPVMEAATHAWVETLNSGLSALGHAPTEKQREAQAIHVFTKFIKSSLAKTHT